MMDWDYDLQYETLQDIHQEIAEFLQNLTQCENRDTETDLEIQKRIADWRERLAEVEPVVPFVGGKS